MLQRLINSLKRSSNTYSGRKLLAKLSAADIELIGRIRDQHLTYLSEGKLANLCLLCRETERQNLPGVFIEAGCALGGSAILIASVKSVARPLRLYDVFGQIPPPTSGDTADVHARYQTIVEGKSVGIGGDPYYGYQSNLDAVVRANLTDYGIDCSQHSVTLIKGLVEDTLQLGQPVAFAHIDVDWYQPVKTCLERIFPNLVVGGSLVLDDYFVWGGCRKAADEYLFLLKGEAKLDKRAGTLIITRSRPHDGI